MYYFFWILFVFLWYHPLNSPSGILNLLCWCSFEFYAFYVMFFPNQQFINVILERCLLKCIGFLMAYHLHQLPTYMVEMMNESGIPNHTRLSCKINLDIDGNIKGTKKKIYRCDRVSKTKYGLNSIRSVNSICSFWQLSGIWGGVWG